MEKIINDIFFKYPTTVYSKLQLIQFYLLLIKYIFSFPFLIRSCP